MIRTIDTFSCHTIREGGYMLFLGPSSAWSDQPEANADVLVAITSCEGDLTSPDRSYELKRDILWRITERPGMDAIDLASGLGIPELQATILVQEMLQAGMLDFDE